MLSRRFQHPWHVFISIAILLFYLIAQFIQIRSGLADNGDYYRMQFWFSSAPVGFSANYPDPSADMEEWNRRFFHYWVQGWKLDFPATENRVMSSTLLLMLPGVWMNQIFYSKDTLYLLFVSLVPRLGGFVFLAALFVWLNRRARQPVLQDLLLGLPLACLLSTTDIIAYYGSFFQETGSLIYLLGFMGVLVFLRGRPSSWGGFAVYWAALLLLSTTKSSQIYWPFLTAPLTYFLTPPSSRRPVRLLAATLGILVAIFAAAKLPAVPLEKPIHPYNGYFTGVLPLSRNPQAHLARSHLLDYADCVGVDAYTPAGDLCLDRLTGKLSFLPTVLVLVTEPAVLVRQFDVLQLTLYQFSSDIMGKFAYGVPEPAWYPFFNWPSHGLALYGPRGIALPIASIVTIMVLLAVRNLPGIGSDLATCGLILLAAAWIDMYVQILGDGQRDLLKHLFLSNICFALTYLIAINAAILLVGEWIQAFQTKRVVQQPI